ncbi:MAG: DNA alkylation repair protein, partial [Muribaculaceae bacterium]|nr:DNA alkylation repair protein [Muribaculaceae bacterium]
MEKTIHAGTLRSIRKEFFALRNGMIADTLRKGGLEQKYIFGLQLPQIKEIALRYKPADEEETSLLARDLWSDKECREGRLLACQEMPPANMTFEEAKRWGEDTATREEADILAFR